MRLPTSAYFATRSLSEAEAKGFFGLNNANLGSTAATFSCAISAQAASAKHGLQLLFKDTNSDPTLFVEVRAGDVVVFLDAG